MKVGILEFDDIGPGRTVVVLVDNDYQNSASNMSRVCTLLGVTDPGRFVIRRHSEILEFDLEESV
tara:strand:+ start:606 stop:800 length:195 start_codon:yes stop_codon:yes gene_type:complete